MDFLEKGIKTFMATIYNDDGLILRFGIYSVLNRECCKWSILSWLLQVVKRIKLMDIFFGERGVEYD